MQKAIEIPLIILGSWLLMILGTVILLEFYLLISGDSILVKEIRVEPGEHYVVEGPVDVGEAGLPAVVCSYFNGYKVWGVVRWYSSENNFVKNGCQLFK